MYIGKINYYSQQNNLSFMISRKSYMQAWKYQKKQEKLQKTRNNEALAQRLAAATAAAGAIFVPRQNPEIRFDNELKEMGITLCTTDNDNIIVSGPHTGFFQVKKPEFVTNIDANKDIPKEIIVQELQYDGEHKVFIGGLLNYKRSVDNMGRQDIINKGLGITDCTIRPNVDLSSRMTALKDFAVKLNNTGIGIHNLFFIGDEAFYYDKSDDAIYSMLLKKQGEGKSLINKCKFILNENNKAIGYQREYWDLFKNDFTTKTYMEQQAPSEKLPEFADSEDCKMYAESARFGNAVQLPYHNQNAQENVVSHLHRIGFPNAKSSDLQILKKKDKMGNTDYNILFYNDNSGRSLVYNKEGKYMYQLEYEKDYDGNIINCCRWS